MPPTRAGLTHGVLGPGAAQQTKAEGTTLEPQGTDPATVADSSDTGNQGGGAPTDAPAAQVRTYSQREFDDNAARQKVAITDQVTKRVEAELLKKLGVASITDAAERISKFQETQKPKKSEADQVAEKITADYQARLETERAARLAAEEALKARDAAVAQEQLRSFVLQHVANTTDPALATALFIEQPVHAPRKIRWLDGHPCVFEGETPMAHIDPAEHIAETLKKPELGFFRKPTSQGSGTRVGSGSAAASVEQKPRNAVEARKSVSHSIVAAIRNRGAGAVGAR